MRLTKQIDLEELGYDYVLLDETKQPSANYKLGQHEDIEDEFGIEILTVVEAVKKGFYDRTGAFHDPYKFSIDLESSCLRETYINETSMCPIPDVFYFDEYGKEWAITMEELL